MYNHAPTDYVCPICLGVQGVESDQTQISQSDIVYKDDVVMAFIASKFIEGNDGHVIVVPNQHYENIYDLPDEVGAHIFAVAKKMALALKKSYNCDGVTTQQNNEPAGSQHAFHYHFHLFPRYKNDNSPHNLVKQLPTTAAQRLPFATKLKNALN